MGRPLPRLKNGVNCSYLPSGEGRAVRLGPEPPPRQAHSVSALRVSIPAPANLAPCIYA